MAPPIDPSSTNSSFAIEFLFEVQGVQDVELMTGIVYLRASFRMYWNDNRLTWDPS